MYIYIYTYIHIYIACRTIPTVTSCLVDINWKWIKLHDTY